MLTPIGHLTGVSSVNGSSYLVIVLAVSASDVFYGRFTLGPGSASTRREMIVFLDWKMYKAERNKSISCSRMNDSIINIVDIKQNQLPLTSDNNGESLKDECPFSSLVIYPTD